MAKSELGSHYLSAINENLKETLFHYQSHLKENILSYQMEILSAIRSYPYAEQAEQFIVEIIEKNLK